MNTMLMTNQTIENSLSKVELSPVNTAILATVPEHLKADTATMLKAVQFSSGVSIYLCAFLYKMKSNPSLFKSTEYKSYSVYCDKVLRIDKSQSSNYANMFEKLYVDVDEPYEKLKDYSCWNVSQLVAVAKIKDRVIRKLFINSVLKSEYSTTNINKAVTYLNTFDRDAIELINWNEVTGILTTGNLPKSENTENATAENTENATAEKSNSCKFTTIKEFEKWLKDNKNAKIECITVTLK